MRLNGLVARFPNSMQSSRRRRRSYRLQGVAGCCGGRPGHQIRRPVRLVRLRLELSLMSPLQTFAPSVH